MFGDGGNLDSRALANFIFVMEQKLGQRLRCRIDLTQDDPFASATGHFKTLPRRLYFIACAEEVNCPGSVGVKGTLLGDEFGETLTSAACGAAAAAERNIVPQTIVVLKL